MSDKAKIKEESISLRRFEALGLLPDTENITVLVRGVHPKQDGTPRFLKTEGPMHIAVDRLPDGASYTLKKLQGVWSIWVVTLVGGKMRRAYLKPDSKKVAAFTRRLKRVNNPFKPVRENAR